MAPRILNSLIQKANSVVETKKATLLQKLEIGSPWLIFINWALTHWITILIVGIISFYSFKNYIQLRDLQATLLGKEIQTLNNDLEKAKEERAKLLSRITEFEKSSDSAKEDTDKVRKETEILDSLKKKNKLLEYKNRLKKVRGYK